MIACVFRKKYSLTPCNLGLRNGCQWKGEGFKSSQIPSFSFVTIILESFRFLVDKEFQELKVGSCEIFGS